MCLLSGLMRLKKLLPGLKGLRFLFPGLMGWDPRSPPPVSESKRASKMTENTCMFTFFFLHQFGESFDKVNLVLFVHNDYPMEEKHAGS